jgi:hypothetical protein
MVGNAIYGAVWTAVLWNPSKYYVGLYIGAGLGFLYYCVILSKNIFKKINKLAMILKVTLSNLIMD